MFFRFPKRFGLCSQVWQQVVANLGDAHVHGLNLEINYAASVRLALGISYQFLEAEADTAHDLDGVEGEIPPDGTFDPEIVSGLRLAVTPEFKAAA